MKVRVLEVEGTADEINATPALLSAIGSFGSDGVTFEDVAEDATEEEGEDAVQPEATDTQGEIPGVPPEGQEAVAKQLSRNSAAELMIRFLEETSSWPRVVVKGIKRKNAGVGEPLDYTDYLRLRKTPSLLGGFAYPTPWSGIVDFRLKFDSDDELREHSTRARRLLGGHREYRVRITLKQEADLVDALKLAKMAYDLT